MEYIKIASHFSLPPPLPLIQPVPALQQVSLLNEPSAVVSNRFIDAVSFVCERGAPHS